MTSSVLPLPLFLFLLTASHLLKVVGFTFNVDLETNQDPTGCGQVTVSWKGGESPFYLVVIPVDDYPTLRTLPISSYNSDTGVGNYVWTVNYPTNTSFVLMMSDNTGIGTGGVSSLYTVQPNTTSCDLRYPASDFWFKLNETDLSQCSPVEISWPSSSFTPVSIVGVIPGGQAFPLVTTSKMNVTSLVWNTNILASTQIILGAFTHGPYGNGGSTDLLTIGDSLEGDSSCINELSPSSTVASDGSTETSTGEGGGGGAVVTVTAISTEGSKGSSGLSTGPIIGIVVISILIALTCQIMLLWFCCRKQIKQYIRHRKEMKGFKTVNLVWMDDSVDLGLTNTQSRNSLASQGHLRRRSINSGITVGEVRDVDARTAQDQVDMRDISKISRGTQLQNGSAMISNHSNIANSISPFADPPESEEYTSSVFGRQGSINSFAPDDGEAQGEGEDENSIQNRATSPSGIMAGDTHTNTTSSSNRPLLSKSQLADLIPTNPDPNINSPTSPSDMSSPTTNPTTGYPLGRRVRPPQNGTRTRTLRMHQDAGPVGLEEEGEVEELPPSYNAEWSRDRP